MRIFTTTLLILLFSTFATFTNAQSLSLDGSDDYVSLGMTGDNILNTYHNNPTDFTIELFFKIHGPVTGTGTRKIFANQNGSTGIFMEVSSSGQIKYGVPDIQLAGGGWNIFTGSTLNQGQWYHAAIVYDEVNIVWRYYLDGAEIGSLDYGQYIGVDIGTGPLTHSDLSFYTGAVLPYNGATTLGTGLAYPGEEASIVFDYFRVWNTARSTTEMSSNYQIEVSCSESDLLAQFLFTDGTGGGNNMGTTTISDCTGNGFDGTAHNFDMTGTTSNFVTESVLLPVELTAFEGFAQKNSNLLNWSTATEENNEGFYIERSENGENWEILDFVHGNGTTYETQYYQYEDNSPFDGENYYRLKQIDFDGQFEYSNIITVENIHSNTNIKVFPNPVVDRLIINSDTEIEAITIFNAIGQPVLQQSAINNTQTEVNVNDLPKGIYTLQLQSDNNEMIVKQFVK